MNVRLRPGLLELDGELFYVERLTRSNYALTRVRAVVHQRRSKYQLIEVVDTYDYGRALYLDHSMQLAESDEFVYHEAFVHPPMLAHPRPARVLIIGGGDGGVLREVLKHPCVEQATLVEIDEEVIETVRRFMPSVPDGAFEDPRSRIIIGDGYKFLRETEERFDLIFVDATDEIGPSIPLYTSDFYGLAKRALAERGIFVTQALGATEHAGEAEMIASRLREHFKIVGTYKVYIPSFAGEWCFVYASDAIDVLGVDAQTLNRRYRERGIRTRFYTPEVHLALSLMARSRRRTEGR